MQRGESSQRGPEGSGGEMAKPRDVTVIGAGMGGLATAALLARAGLRPLVIERADTVGGRGRMRAYRGYRLPVAVRIYGKRAIDALLARLGLTFDFAPIHSPILAFYLTRRRRYLPLPDDLLAGYVDLFAAMGIGRRQARAIGSALAAWVRVPAEEIARLIRTGTAFSEFVRRQVKDPALRHLLFNVTTWVGHGIPDPRRLSAGQFLEKFVFPITEGESSGYAGVPTDQELLDLLAEYIRDHGGEVRLSTEAVRLESGDHRVTGVIVRDLGLESHQRVQSRAVVLAAPVWQALRLADARLFPPRWRAAVGEMPRHEGGLVALWYGLREKVCDVSSWIRFLLPDPVSRTDTLYGGGAMFLSNISPGVAPPGRQLFVAEIMVEDLLARDWNRVELRVGQVRQWARGLFAELQRQGRCTATLEEVTEWEKVAAYWPGWGASHFSVLPTPDVRVPGVRGLYLAGDTVASSRMGFDSAAASGTRCAEAILADV